MDEGKVVPVNVALSTQIIAKSVNASSVEAIWIGTSYFLGSAVLLPLVSSYSDIFGRKPLTQVSLFLFLIGTIICSVAHNAATMLAGRTIQGIGCGGCIGMVDIIIADLIPLKDRAAYFGLVSLSWSFGSAAGPIMGAAFAQNVTWRWLFWILLPFNVTAMVAVAFCLRLRREERDMAAKLREVDVVGSVLFVLSSTSFLIAVSWGGIQFPWGSWHTVVPLVLGLIGLGLFFLWEGFKAEKPMLPVQVFGTWTAAQGYLGLATTGMIMWAAIYYLPLYYEGVLGYSVVVASVGLLPLTLTVAPMAVVTGILIAKSGRYRVFLWAGWAVCVLGMGLMINERVKDSPQQWIFLALPSGIGLGMLLASMQISVQAAARDEDMNMAVAMVPEMRTLGQALGLSIFGAVFTNTVQGQLKKVPASIPGSSMLDQLGKDPIQLVEIIRTLQDGPLKEELVRAIWLAVRAVWITAMGFFVVSALAALWAKHINLDKALNTAHRVQSEQQKDGSNTVEPQP
ncbi:major facilitator superfamily domain-containing protein [Coniochaeta sp. 2T2.1]|nr:major facilitator superfamily domain-containing protein [Coniochaeta sp. 2T2.1]